jgi:hypothetical protein
MYMYIYIYINIFEGSITAWDRFIRSLMRQCFEVLLAFPLTKLWKGLRNVAEGGRCSNPDRIIIL